jgi:hypothetical protein
VTFRVSGEELEAIQQCCVAVGARSVADFARVAVLQKAHMMEPEPVTLSGDLNKLSKQLKGIDASLIELRQRIRSVLGDDKEDRAAAQADGRS